MTHGWHNLLMDIKKGPALNLRTVIRALTGVFLFILVGMAFRVADSSWQTWLMIAVLAALGGNILWAAWRDRVSWLERVGPIP